MIDLELAGKRAIVVGAGFRPERAGHGRAIVQRLTAGGANVACIDMDQGRADAVVAEVKDNEGNAFAVLGDVSTSAGADNAIDSAVEQLGGVDIIVDIVGDVTYAPSEDIGDEEWDWHLRQNLTQVMYVYRAAVRHMIPQGTGGALTSVASVDGLGPAAYHAAYGAAKAGLISFTKTFADEMGKHGIRVNSVAPGNVGGGVWDTPVPPFGSNPINPLVPPRPQDVGDALIFLSSGLSKAITGQVIVVDGGARVKSPWGFTEEMLPQLRAMRPDNYVS